jgi:hypothetical protein
MPPGMANQRHSIGRARRIGAAAVCLIAFGSVIHAILEPARARADVVVRPGLFAIDGKLDSFRWEIAIRRRHVRGLSDSCVSAGIARPHEVQGVSTVCRPIEMTPITVGSSSGSGSTEAGVIAVMTVPQVSMLKVTFRGRRPRSLSVLRGTRMAAKALGVKGFGYAALPFRGPSCLHRLVAYDANGIQVGRPVLGC